MDTRRHVCSAVAVRSLVTVSGNHGRPPASIAARDRKVRGTAKADIIHAMFGRAGHRWCVFVMAMALLWSVGDGGARASTTFGPSFVAASPLAAQKFRHMSMCRGGAQWKSMTGMACAAHCAVVSALVPLQTAFPAITPMCPLPSLTLALEDHRRPPDPHPPKPISLG